MEKQTKKIFENEFAKDITEIYRPENTHNTRSCLYHQKHAFAKLNGRLFIRAVLRKEVKETYELGIP